MKVHSLILLVILVRCSTPAQQNEDIAKTSFENDEEHVEVIVLRKQAFKKELVSNGKLKALKKSDLRFPVSGKLSDRITIKNGQRIAAGQILARLEDGDFRRSLQKSKTSLTIAALELEDYLLSRGLSLKDSASIPKDALDIAKIRSGYTMALQELQSVEFNIQNTVLTAPFPGRVANVKIHAHEQVNASDIFCTLIGDTEFEVEFYLVENEIGDVAVNDKVRIAPNSMNGVFYGYISQINPLVDEHGLILVKAVTKNNDGNLLEGMNVKVFIEKESGNLLVVPRAAVVLRQNQEVLFKYSRGKALWTYVQTGLENSTSYAVIAHPDKGATLEPGDTVIISGNLNLAHESEVKIK